MPITSTFYKLAKKRYNFLRAILVQGRQIDFITKDNEPAADLDWSKDNAVGCFSIFAVLFEGFQYQFCCGGTGKIETDNFHVREFTKGAEKSHGFARAWRSAEQKGLVLRKPRVQNFFVSNGVYGWHDYVGCGDGVSFDFYDRYP